MARLSLPSPTKTETVFLGCLLVVLSTLLIFNFRAAQVKTRDSQRKNDLKHLYGTLDAYVTDFGFFPPAKTGQIVACGTPQNLIPCQWGKDDLTDITSSPPYIYVSPLPHDPQSAKGYQYVYFSSGDQFQILAHLEREQDDEFMPQVKARQIKCGVAICNFGIASSGTALDKSLEAQPKPQPLP